MDTLPGQEIIDQIAAVNFLQSEVWGKLRGILWDEKVEWWTYHPLLSWTTSDVLLIEHNWSKFALKISQKKSLEADTKKEQWMIQQWADLPKILWSGVGRIPTIEGVYYWTIQEYIWGEVWWGGRPLNDAQIDSYVGQLRALHNIHQPWESNTWGPITEERIWSLPDFTSYLESFDKKINTCDFFDQKNRRARIQQILGTLKAKIWNQNTLVPCLIHHDAHPENVKLDTENSCRILDYWSAGWSCPEEELAIIKFHSMPWARKEIPAETFDRIKAKYIEKNPGFNEDLFEMFFLLNSCVKIVARKDDSKKKRIWDQLVEPLFQKAQ